MSNINNDKKQKIRVWDLPTRIYHWLQMLLVVSALVTGFFAPEWWLNYHVWIGYSLIALLVFRLVWGIFGSEYSRFSSFVFSPKTLVAHIKGIKLGKPLHFLGHNPLGALMVFAFIATLLGLSVSGLINLGGVENQGAFASFIDYSTGSIVGRVHLLLAFLLIVMIILHLIGVLFESKISKGNLTKSMLDGDKTLVANEKKPELKSPLIIPAVISIGALAIVIIAGYVSFSKLPASGYITMPINGDYQNECSDCHIVYHPSLLPKKSWVLMMGDLENHFGEDASLDEETAKNITQYLSDYSASSWDSEASNGFRKVDEAKPIEISATPFWISRHSEIEKEVFENKQVRGRGNCEACHKDAKTGRFEDQQISIPKEKIK